MKDRLETIQETIRRTALSCNRNPDEIVLIGVSKTHPADAVRQGIKAGLRHLGENYIQEACSKIDQLGDLEASWHFIGHLQSNKAKFAVPYFDLIHTVDTIKLAKEIDKQARKNGKVQEVLIQVNISLEDSKSGTGAAEASDLARQISALENVALKGLMGMPPFFDDPDRARPYFRELARIRDDIDRLAIPTVSMEHLSMGMSGDYEVAIEEGATMIRIGTAIFGERS